MYSPWVGHWFPGLTPATMIELSLSVFVAMHDYAQERMSSGLGR